MVLEGLYIELVTILWGNAGERLWVVLKTTECLIFFLSIFFFIVAQTEQKEYLAGQSYYIACTVASFNLPSHLKHLHITLT